MKNIFNENKIRFYFSLFFYITLAIIFIQIIPQLYKNTQIVSNKLYHNDIVEITDNAYIHEKDGTIKKISLPYIVDSDTVDKSGFDIDIYLNNIDDIKNKSIAVSVKYFDFSIKYEDTVLGKVYTPKNYVPKNGGGKGYYIIDLPKYMQNNKITMHIIPKLNIRYSYIINPLYVGFRADFLLSLLKKEAKDLFILFLFVLMAITSFIISFLSRKIVFLSQKIFNIGLISSCFVTYFFIRYDTVAYLLSDYRYITHFIQYIMSVLIIFTIFRTTKSSVSPFFVKIFDILNNAIIISYIIRFYLNILGILSLKELYYLDTFLMIFVSVICLISMICSVFFFKYKIAKKELLSTVPIYFLILYASFVYISINKSALNMNISILISIYLFIQIVVILREYQYILKENANKEMYKKLLYIDSLTETYSRYAFDEKIQNLKGINTPITIMTADVNNLKYINDNFSHVIGDKAIIAVGKYLQQNVPNSLIYRTGGDEFIIISDNILEEDFLKNLNRHTIVNTDDSTTLDVIFSIGMCVYRPNGDISIDMAIKISDENMYDDKIRLKNSIL